MMNRCKCGSYAINLHIDGRDGSRPDLCDVCVWKEDALRWRHARKLLTVDDIEGAQGAFDSSGRLVSEHECLRADAAIDAAMAGEIEVEVMIEAKVRMERTVKMQRTDFDRIAEGLDNRTISEWDAAEEIMRAGKFDASDGVLHDFDVVDFLEV